MPFKEKMILMSLWVIIIALAIVGAITNDSAVIYVDLLAAIIIAIWYGRRAAKTTDELLRGRRRKNQDNDDGDEEIF